MKLYAVVAAASAAGALGTEEGPVTIAAAAAATTTTTGSSICDARDYGAVGDGVTLDTFAIQTAVNDTKCGKVILSAAAGENFANEARGEATAFLTGTLQLRSNLELVIEEGVTLLGKNASVYDFPEPNPFDAFQDFGHSHWHNALIWAEDASNVTISGGGALDGGGGLGSGGDMPNGRGDKMLALKSCHDVTLRDLQIRQTGHFALLATNVTLLDMQRLTIRPNRDGIDLVSCSDVYASNLDISGGGDDAFVLKSDYSLGAIIASRNITLENSSSSTNGATALEIGSETVGDFTGIRFRNIEIHSAGNGAIGMAIMDGASVSDVEYHNISISGAASPLQFYIGARQTGHPVGTGRKVGQIRNVLVNHVHAHNMSDPYHPGPPRNWTAMLDGMPANNITPASLVGPNITLQNIAWRFRGGGTFDGGNRDIEPPHPPLGWSRTGPWPSFGLFVRNANEIALRNATFTFDEDDGRPAITYENATSLVLQEVFARRGSGTPGFDILVRNGCGGIILQGGNVTMNESRAEYRTAYN